MNNVLKFAIEQATGHDIVKEAFDYAQDASTQVDKEYVADYLKNLFNGAAESPEVLDAMVADACDSVAQSALVRCKNIQWVDSEGNVDWVAFKTAFISLGEGMYIKTEYASVEALEIKEKKQIQNREKVEAKIKKYGEVMGIIVPVMRDHGFNAGEAIDFLGL